MNPEKQRLDDNRARKANWNFWGPYLSERQWGTVREDYSATGDAWNFFSYEHACSRAYRWGEDGLAGISDEKQRLCFSIGLWNGKDPFLKERLFGLTGPEGNHGEDCKEVYYYLDATPTHSWMKMLYKYPLVEFPYAELRQKNRTSRKEPEFEILDTGIFDRGEYADVFVEYAKADETDILIKITLINRSKSNATLHVIPQLWFRNTWSWGRSDQPKPEVRLGKENSVTTWHPEIGSYHFSSASEANWNFCENETNPKVIFGQNEARGFFKDALHELVVNGNREAVNPAGSGTKCGLHLKFELAPGQSAVSRFRLTRDDSPGRETALPVQPFLDFDQLVERRRAEADAFYGELQNQQLGEDARNVQRQAFAGLIWTKQFYNYDVQQWLDGDPAQPDPPHQRRQVRNSEWEHLNNGEVISMPDKWEYPWYAAWDLAFHCVPYAILDAEFAKEQLLLMLREWYMHPNGQIPAYEWNFSDVNPPVHAWGVWRVYQIDRKRNGTPDRDFLERCFHKLLLNFTWWVNRKDIDNRNVFQGGFLGLDNIGVFDRNLSFPAEAHLDQADGTSWMGMFSLNMMRIALELALENRVYEDIATKFFQHFLQIAEAMNNIGGSGIGLWDDQDKFYYDVLHSHSGDVKPLKIRSLVGLIPLFAVETLEPEMLRRLPEFAKRLEWVMENKPEQAKLVSRWHEPGRGERRLLSLLRGHRMKCLLKRMLDESEFLSEFGVRGLSRYHREHPYVLRDDETALPLGQEALTVNYEPGESETPMFGGNSNWRGPIWFPVNYLMIESMQKFHHYYGDDFKIECPVGSGQMVTLEQAAEEIGRRLSRIFLKDENGERAVYRQYPLLNRDPEFRDYILFYEYFHGDNGRGVGASHQTGWTALIAKILEPRTSD